MSDCQDLGDNFTADAFDPLDAGPTPILGKFKSAAVPKTKDSFESYQAQLNSYMKNGNSSQQTKDGLNVQMPDLMKKISTKLRKKIKQDTLEFIEKEKAIYEEQTFQTQATMENQTHALKLQQLQMIAEKEIDLDDWFKQRDELYKKSCEDHFSNEIALNKSELDAEKKLIAMRNKLMTADPTINTGDYYEKLPVLLKSDLYDCLNVMPKPAVHHIHLTAACPLEFLIKKITYYDFVFYNQKEMKFKVNKNGIDLPGYIRANYLRQYWKSSTDFDEYLTETITLKQGLKDQQSHEIWKHFQPKFDMTFELYNYSRFFEMILYRAAKNMIKQMVTVIEWKHIFGCVFDEEGPLSLESELAIFERVQHQIRQLFPLFTMKIIACGLKQLGKAHVQSQIDAYFAAPKWSAMVSGFDLVQEEDYSPGIGEFLPLIYNAQQKAASLGRTFDLYLHAGESNSRHNKECYEAVLLGTKRIGHGFHLAQHPSLIEMVKTNQICIECCPVSNFVLGYVLDMRNHPARGFLHQGLPVSINPDDPGFMGYEGVTLDYLYAFLSWDLDIADLKKLCLNSLTYASITDQEKQNILKFFDFKWSRFLDYVITKY